MRQYTPCPKPIQGKRYIPQKWINTERGKCDLRASVPKSLKCFKVTILIHRVNLISNLSFVIVSQDFLPTFFDRVFGKFPINTVRDSFSGSGSCNLGTSVTAWSIELLRFFFRGLWPSGGVDIALRYTMQYHNSPVLYITSAKAFSDAWGKMTLTRAKTWKLFVEKGSSLH